MLSTDDLARLRELLAATNGPYTAVDEVMDIGRGMLMHKSVVKDKNGENVIRLGYTDPQVHLFALAANALPELLRVYAAVLGAPEVEVRAESYTFGHGDTGLIWTIGDSYSPPPECVRRAYSFNGPRFRLVPLGAGKGED